MGLRPLLSFSAASVIAAGVIIACGSSRPPFGGTSSGSGVDAGADVFMFAPPNNDDPDLPVGPTQDPKTCAEAETTRSYVGCDYWPTVVANNVWSIFDYAVVISNTGTIATDVSITGGALTATKNLTVLPGALTKVYLPWVPELKGPDADQCGHAVALSASVVKPSGAYHLVSTSPVIVYQFNALEYKGAGGEGPDGGAKDWSACPGSDDGPICADQGLGEAHIGCFSFTNDASLLLPSTAMTTNYRITGHQGLGTDATNGLGAYFAVTATQDATNVTVALASRGQVLADSTGAIPQANGGSTLTFALAHAGDVAEVVNPPGDTFDFSGSLLQTDKPVQVITGVPCINVPETVAACDHTEQSSPPAETFGKHYVVTMPTRPGGGGGGSASVRIYGNEDDTTLTYFPGPPGTCPKTLNAGVVYDCGLVSSDFEVRGDKEFAVSVFMPGGSLYNAQGGEGDPSQSIVAAVEQYRTSYLFLAPSDYDQSYVDIAGTPDAVLVLDGVPVTTSPTALAKSPFTVWRLPLGAGNNGAHTLTSSLAVGIQVIGYGTYTSYQYPGGLNLSLIAPPPVTK